MTTDAPRYLYTVASLGSRTHYQIPRALHEVSALETFVTDFYTPDWFDRPGRFLPGSFQAAYKRRHEARLPSRLVRSRLLLREGLRRLQHRPQPPYIGSVDWSLGRSAARTAKRNGSASLIYGWYWPGFCARGLQQARPNFIWQEHPLPSQVLKVVAAAVRQGWYEGDEPEQLLSPEQVDACDRMFRRADGVIVASDFVRRGVLQAGVPMDRIAVVPLGGDRLGSDAHHQDGGALELTGSLRVLWVGQPVARKGFRQLVGALASLSPADVRVTFVLPSRSTAIALPPRFPPVNIYRQVPTTFLHSLYLGHDLLVMPSLYEGFGMAYLEALSAGLPVVCTGNTGVAPYITRGVDGWVVDPGDEPALTLVLSQCIEDPQRVRAMRPAAAALGAKHTWARFRRDLVQAISALERRWGP